MKSEDSKPYLSWESKQFVNGIADARFDQLIFDLLTKESKIDQFTTLLGRV